MKVRAAEIALVAGLLVLVGASAVSDGPVVDPNAPLDMEATYANGPFYGGTNLGQVPAPVPAAQTQAPSSPTQGVPRVTSAPDRPRAVQPAPQSEPTSVLTPWSPPSSPASSSSSPSAAAPVVTQAPETPSPEPNPVEIVVPETDASPSSSPAPETSPAPEPEPSCVLLECIIDAIVPAA